MRQRLPLLLAAIGGALVVAGLALVLASGAEPLPAPLVVPEPLEADGAHQGTVAFAFVDDGTVRTTAGQLVGGGVVVLGLLVLTALAGWAAGQRTARRRVR